MRMTLETSAKLSQSQKLFNGKITGMGHGGVKDWINMAVGKNQSISSLPKWVFWIMFQNVKIKSSKNIGHTKWTSRVTGAGGNKHLYYRNSYVTSFFFKKFYFFVCQVAHKHHLFTN